MDAVCFDMLVQKVTPSLKKEDTHMRRAVSPGEKLAITLRYLATGESFRSLSFQFCMGVGTVSNFIPEVCDAL